jgi:hypothetical protein
MPVTMTRKSAQSVAIRDLALRSNFAGPAAEAAHDGNAEKGANCREFFARVVPICVMHLTSCPSFAPDTFQSGYAGPSSVLDSEKPSDAAAKRPKLSDPGAVNVCCGVFFCSFVYSAAAT